MVRFFTVKWPWFARLEACLLFAAVVLTCGQLQVVRSTWIASLDLLTDDTGLPQQLFYWTLLSMILAGPYLCLMMVVDRLLALRKGFAVLSIFSVLAWVTVAVALSHEWAASSPAIAREGSGEFTAKLAIAVGTVSLLLRSGAVRLGLAGRGFVSPPLARQPDRLGDRDSIFGDNSHPRPWSVPEPPTQNEREPQRRSGALLLGMLAWGCIFTTVMGGYVLYHDRIHYSPDSQLPLPSVITSGTDAPIPQTHDGHHVFAALVNGHQVSMLFDTGASMVTLRAEDADRLGIPLSRLNFSMRVSTANGIGLVAPTVIDTLTVGSVTQHDVPAFVASPGTLRENLLGQSFLSKLRSYEVENNHVILHPY